MLPDQEQLMEMLKNAVSWFEIPVVDFARAKKFYSTIFDFELPEHQMGPNLMGFLLSEPDGVGGAIIAGEGCSPSSEGILVYLNGGDDLNIVLNRVEKAGGRILLQKTRITDELGHYALFLDTEGNKLGIHSMK